MTIKRFINGEDVNIELTLAELGQAHDEARRRMVEGVIRFFMYSSIQDSSLPMNELTDICGVQRTVGFISDHAGDDAFVKTVAEKFLALPECKGDSTEIVTLERTPLLKQIIAESL